MFLLQAISTKSIALKSGHAFGLMLNYKQTLKCCCQRFIVHKYIRREYERVTCTKSVLVPHQLRYKI